jgi:hypothetical protein
MGKKKELGKNGKYLTFLGSDNLKMLNWNGGQMG